MTKSVPGPSSLPILRKARSTIRFYGDPIKCLRELHSTYGDVAGVAGGDASLVCAFGAENNKQVLSDPSFFHNAADLPIRIPDATSLKRLTTFLVGMNGDDHRRLRKAMTALFSKQHLEDHRDRIVSATETALLEWQPGNMDLSEATANIALRVGFKCLFDLELGDDTRAFARLALAFTSGATSLKNIIAPVALPGLPYRSFMRACDEIEARLSALIAERKKDAASRTDALSTLMTIEDDGGQKLPDALLIGLANELFIAGHETTARTLAWTLFLLERHPSIQRDVVDELKGALKGSAPTVADLDRLPLLDAVVKESMRLLSATPFLFFRRATSAATIGGYELPAGSSIIISPLITHHLPSLYPEPDRFLPSRWLDASKRPGAYEYLPFGAGARMCLGAPLATISVRTILAIVLQRFKVRVPAGSDVSYQARGIILGTKNGMPVVVEAQDGNPAAPAAINGNLRDLVALAA